jgi:hypothetical protein
MGYALGHTPCDVVCFYLRDEVLPPPLLRDDELEPDELRDDDEPELPNELRDDELDDELR